MQTICLTGDHPPDEMKSVLDEALKQQTDFAFARFKKFESECRAFEAKYKMSSEQFSEKFDMGDLGDDAHWFDWYAVNRGRLLWEKKYIILKELKWKA